jgi:pilus assembly protein CpaF
VALDILSRLRAASGGVPERAAAAAGPPALDLTPAPSFSLVPIDGGRDAQELVLYRRLYADLVPSLRQALREAIGSGARRLLVTTAASVQIDFAGLGLLVEVLDELTKLEGSMVVYGLDARVERMLEITQLGRVLAVERHRNEALTRLMAATPAVIDEAELRRIHRHLQVLANAESHPDDAEETPRQRLTRIASAPFVEWLTQRGMPNREDAWDQLRVDTRGMVERLARDVGLAVAPEDCDQAARLLVADLHGMGPLQPFLDDPLVSEVMVSGREGILVERAGRLERTDVSFRDEEHLIHTIRRVAERMGRRIDFANPSLDARLENGARVHALLPPVALDGPTLTIRKFGVQFRQLEDLISSDTLSPEIAYYLGACVKARLNLAIGGPAAAGKTTLLNALAAQVPRHERIVTIEEVAELDLSEVHPHVVRLQARSANTEARGEITIRQLVREALRMRADRILVGEARGAEMIEVLQAMRCGHDGSMTTIHASSPEDLIERATTIALFASLGLSDGAVRRMVVDGLDVILFLYRFADGHRRVVRVTEPYRNAQGDVAMNDVFAFEHEGYAADGRVQGRFRFVAPSRHEERFRLQGIEVPWHTFAAQA